MPRWGFHGFQRNCWMETTEKCFKYRGAWQTFPEETYSNGKIKATRTVVWSVLKYWMVGWMVERLTAVVVVHRHNLRQQISGSAPETSLLPSPPATGGLLKTKEDPEQSQERATNELKSPTVTGHQPLAKHKPSKAAPKTPTVRNPLDAPQSRATPCH